MKKIKRISKYDKVIANMLTEDLQCEYDKILELDDDIQRAIEEDMESGHSDETAKKTTLLFFKKHRNEADFWEKVYTQYGYWGQQLQIRDGYALVINNPMKAKKGMMKFFKKFINDMDIDDTPDQEKSGGEWEVE